jgi:hypothetical protein
MSFFSLALFRSSLFFSVSLACSCARFSPFFFWLACSHAFLLLVFFFFCVFFFFFFWLAPPLAGCLLACFPSNSSSSHSFAHCATRRQENICEYGLLFFFPFLSFQKEKYFFCIVSRCFFESAKTPLCVFSPKKASRLVCTVNKSNFFSMPIFHREKTRK